MRSEVQQGLLEMMGNILVDTKPTVEQVEAAQNVTRLSNRKKEFLRIRQEVRDRHPSLEGWEVTFDLATELKELIAKD